MDTRDDRFDWNRMRAFVATADTGSFSAAARRLGLTQPTLGRQVAALEEEMGVTLFERAGRTLRMTQTAADLLPHARQMAEAASRMSVIATGQSQSIDGTVRITASDVFSAHILPGPLHRLRELAPRLRIDLVATNDLADVLSREADVAIRHIRPTEPDLFARRIAETTANLYAAKSYLDARGWPDTPASLARHDFISLGDDARMIELLAGMGAEIGPENFRAGSRNGLVAWELVQRGLGIAPMADRVAAQAPEIARVLPDQKPIRVPVWLVTHRELHTSRRIRLVFDTLADALSDR